MRESADTVVARATPPGRGGVAVIRISGPAASDVLVSIIGSLPTPRVATLAVFTDSKGQHLDQGLALWFPGPASYSGEDMAELHCHGGPVVVDLVLGACLQAGARLAEPGEFSRRAFLNDKLDLSQAEAIADLIDAGTEAGARAATRSLEGALSEAVLALTEAVSMLRTHIEAAIDFPEDDEDFLKDRELNQRLEQTWAQFRALDSALEQGRLVREGIQVVIAGPPNSGKSSLLNALSGRDAAIVTDIPGTTRDLVREQIQIGGMPIHIVDTAGMRPTSDPVETEGVERARNQVQQADLVLLVQEANGPLPIESEVLIQNLAANGQAVRCIRVLNKVDLTGEAAGPMDGEAAVRVSALTGAGLGALRSMIGETVGYAGDSDGLFSARRRHRDALSRARAAFDRARCQLREQGAGELAADELRDAQNALSEITGEFGTEDLLERIFSGFCIGK